MPVRAFRDEFLREPEPTYDLPHDGGEDRKRGHFDDDPRERGDYEREEEE